ncbi:MAG: hypothetical protein A2163_06055 [Actinobacteria bacterium RBG_13_35_12]|nr:MAG: hypothetical protein A2163_06055 [Actinobacteria bacterium RBG_13_35_12]
MIQKTKIILILILCLSLILAYVTGCFLDGTDLTQETSEEAGNDTDESGNDINNRLTELKDQIVSSPVVLSHESGEVIYGSGERELIFIKGYADSGNTIEVYINGILEPGIVVVDNNGNFETLNGIIINEGKNTIELVSISPSGKESNPTEFDLYLSVPQKVEYKIFENSDNLKEIIDTYYSTESNPLVYIKGSHLPSSRVSIQVNDKIVGEVVSDDLGVFELDEVVLGPGNNEIAVWGITSDGFTSAPVFSNVIVTTDMGVPYPSNLTGYKQGNANYLSWNSSIDVDFDSYKLVRVEDPCVNPEYPDDDVIVTFNNINASSYIDSDIISGNSYYYTLWTLDKAGRVVSSNVVAIPKPVYSITLNKLTTSSSNTIARREWFYQPYELTNTGNVTIDVQPIMLWLKLEPNPDEEMEISPLWEVHIWDPTGEYYYSNEDIYSTYISDWRNFDGTTETEETTTFSADGLIKTVTVTETTKKTAEGPVNQKRIMTTTTNTTITVTNTSTGVTTVTTASDTDTEIVEPEIIGSPITGLKPGEKIIIEVKIQNIAAENGEKFIAHFHFAPVDCDGRYYIDEIKSSLDVTVIGSSRN